MSLHTRCTRCGALYKAVCLEEKRDLTRICARCYVETHQPTCDLFQRPEARDFPERASLPAAPAAGFFTTKE